MLKPMKEKPSLQTIADRLGVSKVTISRALRHEDGVSDELRNEIIRVATEIGYKMDALRLRNTTTQIAFILPMRYFLETDHFYKEIFFYFDRLCAGNRSSTILCLVDQDMERDGVLPQGLNNADIRGIIVGGELAPGYFDTLAALGLPTVVVDYYTSRKELAHVVVNNYELGYTAGSYLLAKGHRDIGFVGGYHISSNVADRIFGVRKALQQEGSDIPPHWVIENNEPQTGLYSLNFTLPEKLPTAFICHCDLAAYYLVKKLQSLGKRVPEDVSVVSFDDTETAVRTVPPLTSIRIDRELFARHAMAELTHYLKNHAWRSHRTYLDAHIVERSSVMAHS